MMKRVVFLGIVLGLGACARHQAGEAAAPRRLLALTYSLEQANERAARENDYLLWTIQREVAGGRYGQLVPNSAVAQLLAHTDTIWGAAKQWRAQLLSCRQQLSALATNGLDVPLSPAEYTKATRQLARMAASRAALLAQASQLVFPRPLPPRLTADTTAAALADFYFRDATPAAALAALAQLEAVVLTDEAAALQAQSMRLACGGNIIYDSTHAQALADTAVVVAGTEYRASLFLAAVLKPAGLAMSVNGQPVIVSPSGFGQVRFVADPRLLGGRAAATAYWTGIIRARSPYTQSGDTTYQVRVPYRIVRRE